jgi:hypothetical protein
MTPGKNSAANQVGELLKAVSLFAVGGLADAGSVRLIAQLK